MRKATKIVISFAVVLIAGLNLIVPALAQDPFTAVAIGGLTGLSAPGLFGSMAAMSGVNINYSSTDDLNAMWDVTNPNHVYFSGQKHEADPQQYPEDVYDYIDVNIGDWLNAQSEFIVKLIQDNSIDNNDTGSITTPTTWRGIQVGYSTPVYTGINTIQVAQGVYMVCRATSDPNNPFYVDLIVDGITQASMPSNNPPTYQFVYYQATIVRFIVNGTIIRYTPTGRKPSSTTSWTSNTVNSHVYDGWNKARVKIPRSANVLSANWTIPDFVNAINQLWENNQQGLVVIEDVDQPVPPPTPTPLPTTPISDVPFDEFVDLWGTQITNNQVTANDKLDFIGSNGEDQLEELEDVNTALTDLNDTVTHIDAGVSYILQDADNIDTNVGSIEEHTENIDTNLDSLVDTVDSIDTNITSIESIAGSIDTNIDDLTDTAESIDTNIGIGNGILSGIRSLAQSAVDYLEGIAEHVAELVEEIVEGTETLIAGILNQIPQAFSVIFGPIKQASSIWHYVVEWIQSIGAPFQFIWSMASGTSYYVILPVYASLAAAVVLAFFKRFGR